MLRLILTAFLLLAAPGTLGTARAADFQSTTAATLPDAPPLHPATAFHPAGPARARGAAVWLHGGYDSDEFPNGPPEPAWITRLAKLGYDIWRFDRVGRDPLGPGGEALARGLEALRAGGYRRIVVAGHSRGAFIALSALAQTGMVDALAAISPAAHGTNPARRAQAMSDYRALLEAAKPMRFALVQLDDDPFDPDPDGRVAAARAAASRVGLTLMVIDRPAAPTGHMGSYEPAFDERFGACLAAFLDGTAGPDACAAPSRDSSLH